ncbi:MAG: HAMP domain-containing histidine kinase [Hyphomonadaceae bacterium]|nr:HAMP domain-containing histidine kinase [Hyphomonadaceae bacterium]
MDSADAPKNRFQRLSLARRLLLGALLWSILLVVGGVLTMTAVYRAETLNLLDDEHADTIRTLARAIRPLDDGTGRIEDIEERHPTDPRFTVPLSGKYWMIVAVDENGDPVADITSRSVFDETLVLPAGTIRQALDNPGQFISENAAGPAEEPARYTIQATSFPERENPVLLVAISDRTLSMAGVDRLRTILLVAMLALAGGTLLAMALGLRYALRPLDRVQSDLTEIREGRQAALSGDYPAEVTPLSEELNKLLEHNRAVVSRARTHVGNLAHALKTPLAVLRNEATGDTQLDEVVRRQSESMRSNVDHYLRRAQAAARAEALGARTQVLEAADGIARVMNKLFAAEDKTVSVEIPADIFVRTERQDLEEILGNLLDNACKWTKTTVVLSAEQDGDGMVVIRIDDDGPGLSPEEREQAVKRGVRIDETAPGTGLGLSIVADIADMNGGNLTLKESPMGGLRASVRLRRA